MPSTLSIAAATALLFLSATPIPDTYQVTLSPTFLTDDDAYGAAVALSGKLVIAGAAGHDEHGSGAGAAYILKQGGHGLWTLDADLSPDNIEAGDVFGTSVDVSGKVAIVGAPGDDDEAMEAGAVYFFRKLSNGWDSVGKIFQPDAQAGAGFGKAVAITANSAIVGAPNWHQVAGLNSGAYTIFVRDRRGRWIPDVSEFGAEDDVVLGASVAMAGKYAVVGAPGMDSTGAVRILRLEPREGWSTRGYLTASDGSGGDQFGTSVDTDGKSIIVGAPSHFINARMVGAAYVFVLSGGTWVQEDILIRSTITTGTKFGVSVAISGDFAIVGAPEDGIAAASAGSYYLFHRLPGGAWTQYGEPVTLDGAQSLDRFGTSVALEKANAVIGTPGFNEGIGAAVVFR